MTNDFIELIVHVDQRVVLPSAATLLGCMEVRRDVLLNLSFDSILPLLVDRISVVVIVVDGKVLAILKELIQFAQGCLAPGLECITDQSRP